MEPIVVSQDFSINDPQLMAIADQVVKSMQLASVKAVAHHFDPDNYPLDEEPDSFEQIFLFQFENLQPDQQETARIQVMESGTLETLLEATDSETHITLSESELLDYYRRSPVGYESEPELLDYYRRSPVGEASPPPELQQIPLEPILPEQPEPIPPEQPEPIPPERILSIDDKYQELGGAAGFLGAPVSEEEIAADGVGKYRHYEGGSIYWHPNTGAFEIYGFIREKWMSLGAEQFLGYPITGETSTPDGVGRFNHFQYGSIYWTPNTGAQAVYGAIRALWSSLGWELSHLGYPVTDELDTADNKGRYSVFQRGTVLWYPETGAYVGTTNPISKLAFQMVKLHCINETDGFLGSHAGEDEIYIGGAATDTYGKVSQFGPIDLGDYDSNEWSKWLPITLHTFDVNQQDSVWPKTFLMTQILVEVDAGDYNKFLNALVARLQPYVEKKLRDYLVSAGEALGGEIGAAIGAIAAEIAAYIVNEIFKWIKSIWENDTFIPLTEKVTLPGPGALFAGGAYERDFYYWVKGHGGHYEWSGKWLVR